MSSPVSQGVDWFHPGEVLLVARVANDLGEEQLHRAIGAFVDADPATLRSYVFGAEGEDRSIGFVFGKLANAGDARTTKRAVEAMHPEVGSWRNDAVEVLGVMPHWHTRAHEMTGGGSPGSFPVPVRHGDRPDGTRRHHYRIPAEIRSDGGAGSIPVAVLDARVDLDRATSVAGSLGNAHLNETLANLRWSQGKLNTDEWREVANYHEPPASDQRRYSIADHGLFIAGLIHDLAPRAALSLTPVLDEYGVGDLSVLLAALRDLLDNKPSDAPQIVNLSLGFRPHPAHLVAAWHGLQLPGTNPTYSAAPDMNEPEQGWDWLSRNSALVKQRTDFLQAGLSELGRYLSLNNCLVVAAAGNDSHLGELRLEPRLPARFATVLGVAATTADGAPASYSNIGEEQRRGDHVATFGGERDNNSLPVDAVVGIYAGEFPSTDRDTQPVNETGWAYWSGTSFATGIVSGIAANVWAANPSARANDILAEVHELARKTRHYVSELRTYSIGVDGQWD